MARQPEVKVIQTRHDGYHFRSRTEARWAVFFTELGIDYEYESEGYDVDGRWYLPDFVLWLPGRKRPLIAEVKGRVHCELEGDHADLCWSLSVGLKRQVLLLVGPPAVRPYYRFTPHQLQPEDEWDCGFFWDREHKWAATDDDDWSQLVNQDEDTGRLSWDMDDRDKRMYLGKGLVKAVETARSYRWEHRARGSRR